MLFAISLLSFLCAFIGGVAMYEFEVIEPTSDRFAILVGLVSIAVLAFIAGIAEHADRR